MASGRRKAAHVVRMHNHVPDGQRRLEARPIHDHRGRTAVAQRGFHEAIRLLQGDGTGNEYLPAGRAVALSAARRFSNPWSPIPLTSGSSSRGPPRRKARRLPQSAAWTASRSFGSLSPPPCPLPAHPPGFEAHDGLHRYKVTFKLNAGDQPPGKRQGTGSRDHGPPFSPDIAVPVTFDVTPVVPATPSIIALGQATVGESQERPCVSTRPRVVRLT